MNHVLKNSAQWEMQSLTHIIDIIENQITMQKNESIRTLLAPENLRSRCYTRGISKNYEFLHRVYCLGSSMTLTTGNLKQQNKELL